MFVVAFSWLMVARAVFVLHLIDGYVAGFLFILGLCLSASGLMQETQQVTND